MRLEFEVELPDAPGELSRVLEDIAGHGGNVQAVIHRHERAKDSKVPVVLTVEIDEALAIGLLDALARRHRLLRVNREGGPVRSTIVLAGHVFEADLKALLDKGFEAGAEFGTLDARLSGRADPSAVLLTITAEDHATLARARAALEEEAAANELTLMDEVRGDDDA